MFEEIEKMAKEGKNEGNKVNDVKKLFQIDDISNKDIGQKIKSFTKFFLKLQVVLYVIAAAIMLIAVISSGGEEEAIIALLISVPVLAIAFIGSYYMFLIISGFGALVEDVNSLTKTDKKSENSKSKK